MKVRLMYVHALSPVHPGTGQSVGAIDLAIARDRATGFPYIPGSSIKGALRDRARGTSDEVMVFGPDTSKAHEHAGSLIMGDANLLLMPVRSISGTFAWATSPYLLARYARDAQEAGMRNVPSVPTVAALGDCQVCTGTGLVARNDQVVFEDLEFEGVQTAFAGEWAEHLGDQVFAGDPLWPGLLIKRLCILHDDAMSFLATHATDVVARIAINHETKTVKDGQLWYEENLPAESILVAMVGAQPVRGSTPSTVMNALTGYTATPLQLGGNATVGRGRCRLVLSAEHG